MNAFGNDVIILLLFSLSTALHVFLSCFSFIWLMAYKIYSRVQFGIIPVRNLQRSYDMSFVCFVKKQNKTQKTIRKCFQCIINSVYYNHKIYWLGVVSVILFSIHFSCYCNNVSAKLLFFPLPAAYFLHTRSSANIRGEFMMLKAKLSPSDFHTEKAVWFNCCLH